MDNSELNFQPDLVCRIKSVMEEAGFTDELVEQTVNSEFQTEILKVLKGESEIIAVELSVNLDLEPFLPGDWRRLRHQTFGKWKWDPAQLELYLAETQREGKGVRGKKLIKPLQSRRALNACVLDHLRRHPKLLPASWRKWLEANRQRTICFIGTTYADHESHECVRCLWLNDESRLIWKSRKLEDYWDGNDAIVLMIS